MKMTFAYPEDRDALNTFVAENQPCHVWRKGDSVVVYTGDDIPVKPVPKKVTPRQIRLALNQLGLRNTVEQAVLAAGTQDIKDWWEYALDIERKNPLIVSMATQLGITDQQLDDIFRLAATL